MTQPTSWAELQHQLLANGNTPVPVTDQNRAAAETLKAKGLAVINNRHRLGKRAQPHVKLKEQAK